MCGKIPDNHIRNGVYQAVRGVAEVPILLVLPDREPPIAVDQRKVLGMGLGERNGNHLRDVVMELDPAVHAAATCPFAAALAPDKKQARDKRRLGQLVRAGDTKLLMGRNVFSELPGKQPAHAQFPLQEFVDGEFRALGAGACQQYVRRVLNGNEEPVIVQARDLVRPGSGKFGVADVDGVAPGRDIHLRHDGEFGARTLADVVGQDSGGGSRVAPH